MDKEELATLALASVKRAHELERLSSQDLADLLMAEVWSSLDLFSFESDIVMEAIERLQKVEVMDGC
jgi:hypothetical protein